MTNIITFQNTQMDIIDHIGRRWLRAPQIAEALGFKNSKHIFDLFKRNKTEFDPDMTAMIELPTSGGPQMTRIFSPRGAWLLGFFARTKVAAEFRRWVLDMLEGKEVVAAHQSTIPSSRYIELLEVENAYVRLTAGKRRCIPLTEEQKREISRLNAKGLTIAEIHHEIGRHKTTIGSFLKRQAYGHA